MSDRVRMSDLAVEASPDPVVVANAESGLIQQVSGDVSGLFGYDPDALIDEPQTVLHPDDAAEAYRECFEEYAGSTRQLISTLSDGSQIEIETADGTRLPVEIHATTVEHNDETFFVGAFHDISERVAHEQQLQRQRDNLELLNQVVRHDIRNDLQLIEAYAEMLEDCVAEDGEEYLDILQESTHQAVELTKTARNLSEVMLHHDAETKPMSLRRTLETQVEDIRSTYPGAIITLNLSADSDVLANDMLDVVFRNLLKNAIHHNDKTPPEVTVTTTETDEAVQVRVADNGPGVSDAHKAEIFGKGNGGLESEGTGVGLYLVSQLVDIYGGDVWVADNEPTGAVFVVELQKAV